MNGSQILLEMFKKYKVEYVFGLPGETTIGWYKEWIQHPEIQHILVRDVRSAAYMAEAYAKVTHKPGVCEGPSPGASYLLPGVIEAFKASVPLLVFTSDVPFNMEYRNMLTGYNQTALFESVTKATFLVTKARDLPFILRRAFRLAVTGKPGPVHIRIPADVFGEEAPVDDLYAQDMFIHYPGHRYIANPDQALRALQILIEAKAPLMICGQGVHHSQAYDEVRELVERLQIPVGTTMTGKGCVSDDCQWHIGVIGARGGVSLSNKFVEDADVIFFVGTNTDSAGTNAWSLPKPSSDKIFIQLDISEAEVGNNYPVSIALVGDVKSTLGYMLRHLNDLKNSFDRRWSLRDIQKVKEYRKQLLHTKEKREELPLNPLNIMEEVQSYLTRMRDNILIVVDPGVGCIYSSALLSNSKEGLWYIAGYSIGALGYAVPAAVGAWLGNKNNTIIVLTGDGSFGFVAGELETLYRLNANIKILLFRNDGFGWIRAEEKFGYNLSCPFATEFSPIDYAAIASGFGIKSYKPTSFSEFCHALKESLINPGPSLIEILVLSEDEFVPPVPKWVAAARNAGIENVIY